MREKKDHTVLIHISIILICIFGLLFLFNNKKDNTIIEEKKIYRLVKDYSRFFTVNSCIYRYFTYLSNKDVDSLLKVLNEDYIKKNNIDSNNLFDFVPNLDDNYSFTSTKMYSSKISDNYFEYYVYGYTTKDGYEIDLEKKYYYFRVDFDQENTTFSIMPISQTEFEEINNG